MRTLVAFDCYGTLVDFDLDRVVRGILAERLRIDGVDEADFLHDFRVMRFQAVLEEYRPYHGVQMASLMGARMAEVMDGHPEANPWRHLRARAFPTYSGTAWFLPFVGAFYRMRDWLT